MSIESILLSQHMGHYPYNGFVISELRLKNAMYHGNIAIFGTGDAGLQAYNFCVSMRLNVSCFIDDYKQGDMFDIPIINRAQISGFNIGLVIVGYGQKGDLNFNNITLVKLHFLAPYIFSEIEINKMLYLGVEYVCKSGVEGYVAEFGTNSGRTTSVLAYALNSFSTNKKLICFDSFEGLPSINQEVDKNHQDVINGVWKQNVFCDLDKNELSHLIATLLPRERIEVHQGWFKDSMLNIQQNAKFALVHIDADLYSSAIDVLDYLLSRKHISEGCLILFDDFNCSMASNSLGERRAWKEMVEKYSIDYSNGGWYGWAGWKFIVHKYL